MPSLASLNRLSFIRHMPSLRPGLHDARDLKDLGFADQVGDGGHAEHDLERGDAAAADLAAQHLRDDALQAVGEHDADLFLLRGRVLIDDAVDGAGRRRGVQRAEDQVTGFGRLERDGDGLEIAHFAQQHDVRDLRAARRAAPS